MTVIQTSSKEGGQHLLRGNGDSGAIPGCRAVKKRQTGLSAANHAQPPHHSNGGIYTLPDSPVNKPNSSIHFTRKFNWSVCTECTAMPEPLKIVIYPDPRLKKPSVPIAQNDACLV